MIALGTRSQGILLSGADMRTSGLGLAFFDVTRHVAISEELWWTTPPPTQAAILVMARPTRLEFAHWKVVLRNGKNASTAIPPIRHYRLHPITPTSSTPDHRCIA